MDSRLFNRLAHKNADRFIARQYAYHLLHDFYDDRETVLGLLREKGRVATEDQPIDPPENPE
ncbi:hypothetical protein A8E36_26515 [Burkholderia cenocepacia]|uniref:hypothetical protein n=1 Tax=Burkholderia cenocepacia TaxID=95486 RepID=UPI00098168D3|nr:hypothetical protein [Burkholderia cenocepacia]ONS67659.1 hypothetical protein A8E33_05075 [Burkholderia cenocepacia]ONS83289.1 hypothetical protein A8E35_16515 [Burkholderia cenocepacia]ONS86543.1 hypothetical protein A8E34_08495 [Burkholderia cenocepacia]ONS99368.1 hypothetical protein A8E36_26515 [Burkholderia cenocepacia]ONT01593.1 hypothetical protein A8E37_17530 [Burkholderia cenocepacia]